jgi:periplasmic protein TonB
LQEDTILQEDMFADSLLESSGTQRARRGWTTLSSFGLQALMMTILLLLPLIRPIGLPFLKPLAAPVMLSPPPGLPPAQAIQRSVAAPLSNMINNLLVAPRSIPTRVATIDETVPPPQFNVGVGLPGGTGDPRGVLNAAGPAGNPVMPLPPPPVANHVRVSRMMEGNLIRRVQPEYPPTARMAHVQGQVVLSAIISKAGTIEKVQVLSGHPLLVQSAVEAVKQWRYRPYILNDEPVEVETQITVNFTLGGG